MEENFEILSQCPLFSSIGREDLESMLQCLGVRRVFYLPAPGLTSSQ